MDWAMNITAPIVVALIVGPTGWFLRQYFDSVRREQERLQDERRKIYMQALEPYIRLLNSVVNKEDLTEEDLKQILSYEYRRNTFELKLMGSDDVVRALNKLRALADR